MAAPYPPRKALDLIRKILNEGGYIAPSRRHARQGRMSERDVDMQDLEILLLETGTITRKAEWEDDHQNYKYRVEGKDDYGDDLTAIVVIDETNWRIKVVTVFD
ncbi:MAG: DUF4258 domain-containing protein [Chloracidobacterium sp.]|nr:DUF4258 domain-containing protein [Chloracidobacterium sp.]